MIALTIAVIAAIIYGALIIRKEYRIMSAALDRLTAEVAETRTANASALALIAGLAKQIRDNVSNESALTALADDLDAGQKEIADAVTANSAPADQPPAPPA